MQIGDIVTNTTSDTPLASGCGCYSCAIVISMEPFRLLSEGGDMHWVTKKPEDFMTIGQAQSVHAQAVLDRLNRDRMFALPEESVKFFRDLATEAFNPEI